MISPRALGCIAREFDPASHTEDTRMRLGRWLWGGLLALVVVSSARGAGIEALDARVDAVLKTPGYQAAHWGLLVVDAATGQTVYERNADQMFCPASVTKVFTTSAALDDLGADYRFQTPVVRVGEIDAEGTLKGDLILVAQGDLSLGGRTGPGGTLLYEDHDHTYASGNLEATLVKSDPLAGLDHLAREIKEAGIKTVTGDVIIDDRLFLPARSSGSGPGLVTPILVNDNVVDVVVTPAEKPGEPASVAIVPVTAFVTIDAQVETVAEGQRPTVQVRAVGARRFSVRGKVPVGHKPVVKIYEVEEPAAFARALLIESLRKRGVRVSAAPIGQNAVDKLPPRDEVAKLPKVAEYTSPPFREYIRVILKVSHNLYASTLPLLVAAHHGERTLSAGLKREGQFFKSAGLEAGSIAFGGGAGGERADLVTPRATVALLRAMAGRPDFPAFEAALPVLGRDGTLVQAVPPDSPARGHARAKSGTYSVDNGLNGKVVLTSKALAGYMENASGRTLVFAFFLNNVPIDATSENSSKSTTAAGQLLGRMCEAFYSTDTSDKPRLEAAPARSEPGER
jgi:serine-type D-Ala-D-Ala carboxypeptidase/endopeptidase (penicillin-binding protein 4)